MKRIWIDLRVMISGGHYIKHSTKAIHRVLERLHIQSVHLFCCSRSLIYGVQCDVKKLFMQLYVGPCYVVSEEIAVAMAVPIENPVDCEVRGVFRFLQPMRS